MKVLRSAAQYAQWIHYYESMGDWDERSAVAAIRCPRMVFFGGDGDLIEAGIPVSIASHIRANRPTLQHQGWVVQELTGLDHGGAVAPALCLPPVRAFLDARLGGHPSQA